MAACHFKLLCAEIIKAGDPLSQNRGCFGTVLGSSWGRFGQQKIVFFIGFSMFFGVLYRDIGVLYRDI